MSQPVAGSAVWNLKVRTQVNETSGYSSNSQDSIPPGVPVLVRSRCPNAIRNFVTHRIIYTLNGPTSLTGSHVLKKQCEGMPAVTNCDSAFPIIFECGAFGVGASVQHSVPNVPDAVVAHPVSGLGFHYPLFEKTSARLGEERSQQVIVRDENCATVALASALPSFSSGRSNVWRRISKHDCSSKSLSDDVSFGRHNGSRPTVVFSGDGLASTNPRCDFARRLQGTQD